MGAAGAEASGPRGPSPGSPRLPGLSSRRRRHRRCSSRLCQCRRSLDLLLFPWLRPAWQLVGCQAWGGGRGRGETGREEGRGREGREREGRGGVGKGGWRSAQRGTRRRSGDPGCLGLGAAGVVDGWLPGRCGDAERRPCHSVRGAGMKLSGEELRVGACHSQLGGGAPPRGKYW